MRSWSVRLRGNRHIVLPGVTTRFFATALVACSVSVGAQEAGVERVRLVGTGAKAITGIAYYNEAFHLTQERSPVRITNVKIRHVPSETAAKARAVRDTMSRYLKDHERINLRRFSQESLTITVDAHGEDVVAVKFSVVVYDAFKEYLGGLTAVTMDPPTALMDWEYRPPYLFKFKKYGVVGVYVRQARLRNGQIWNFDEDSVARELSERFGEITKEQLAEPDGTK